MSQELSVTAAFAFSKNGIASFARAVTASLFDVSASGGIYHPGLSIATGGTTIQLGGLTSPFGWAWFHNLDSTNFVKLFTASGQKEFARLKAGAVALLPLGNDVTAPYAIADTAAILLEYAILPP